MTEFSFEDCAATKSFQKFAYADVIKHVSSFKFRIVSGSQKHDRSADISPKDNLLIVSKDSIGRNMQCLDAWLAGEDEIYLIVDEAHHSTAKTYRKIIDYVAQKVKRMKLIGLTATPFRTAENEQGLLAKIYTDGIKNGKAVHGDVGITFQIGLKELISRQILAKPIFESLRTDQKYGEALGLRALESIQNLDTLPDDIAEQMAKNQVRNDLIVDTYKRKQNDYGQTIVFAVNVVHALQLNQNFKNAGIASDCIISSFVDEGVVHTAADNERVLERYRKGELQVLVNVNILTEGVDLPQTKTVFLARPTVSSTLMTQMVGRALRGTAAGGTDEAYIVSFVDSWNDKIAWVSPENIFEGSTNDFVDRDNNPRSRLMRMLSIAKIEEFASILDDAIDTRAIERVPFEQRIPIGMYAFQYVENEMDHSCQVMVYDCSAAAYKEMMKALPSLFEDFGIEDETLSDAQLTEMEQLCHDSFFCGEMVPPYEAKDIRNILKYYANKGIVPKFYTFKDVDRSKLDVGKIAKKICDENMSRIGQSTYLNSLWDNGDENMLRLFFGKKIYFLRMVDIEIERMFNPELFRAPDDNVKFGTRALEDMTLHELGKIAPNREAKLRDEAFAKSLNSRGKYTCAMCGRADKYKTFFHVDHIKALNKGGKSVPENLQILCRSCNAKKSDN